MCLGNSITDQSQRRINSEYVSLPDIRDESSGWTRNVSQESFSDSFLIYSMRYTLIRLEKHPQSIGQIPLPLEKVLIQTSKGFLNSNFITTVR